MVVLLTHSLLLFYFPKNHHYVKNCFVPAYSGWAIFLHCKTATWSFTEGIQHMTCTLCYYHYICPKQLLIDVFYCIPYQSKSDITITNQDGNNGVGYVIFSRSFTFENLLLFDFKFLLKIKKFKLCVI